MSEKIVVKGNLKFTTKIDDSAKAHKGLKCFFMSWNLSSSSVWGDGKYGCVKYVCKNCWAIKKISWEPTTPTTGAE